MINRKEIYNKFLELDAPSQMFIETMASNFVPMPLNAAVAVARTIEREYKCGYNIMSACAPLLRETKFGFWEYLEVIDSLKVRIIHRLHTDGLLYSYLKESQRFESGYSFDNKFVYGIRIRSEIYSFLDKSTNVEIDLVDSKQGDYSPLNALYEALIYDGFNTLSRYLTSNSVTLIARHAAHSICNNLDSEISIDKIHTILKKSPKYTRDSEKSFVEATAIIKLLQGDYLEYVSTVYGDSLEYVYSRAIPPLFEGDAELSIKQFDLGLKLQKKVTKEPYPYSTLYRFIYAIALIRDPKSQSSGLISKLAKNKFVKEETILNTIFAVQNGEQRDLVSQDIERLTKQNSHSPLYNLLLWMACKISGIEFTHPSFDLEESLVRCQVLGFDWLLMEIYALLDERTRLEPIQEKLKFSPITVRQQSEDEWERILNAIIGQGEKKIKDPDSKIYRVAYLYNHYECELSPIVQQSKDGITWTRGKAVSLQRFATYQAEGITEQDKRIADCVARDSYYRRNYEMDFNRALRELVGHPYVFLAENPSIPVEVASMKPELTISNSPDGYKLQTNVENVVDQIQVIRESNTRVRVLKLTSEQQTYLKLLQQLSNLPHEAKDKLLVLLKKLTGIITVYSDLIDESENLKTLEGDSRIFVQLIPIGDTLKAELFIKPFTQNPPYCKAGVGALSVIGVSDGEKAQATRNLEQEINNLEIVKSTLDRIVELEQDEDTYYFDDPYHSLELMESIASLSDIAVVEWPEGVKFKISGVASFNNLSLSLKGKGNWFDLEGELKVGEDTIFSMRDLLNSVRKSKGRFIELNNGEFLALTEQFRRQLMDLDSIIQESKDGGFTAQNLAASMIEELQLKGVDIEADRAFKDMQQRISTIATQTYKVPKNLQAELRDYQTEGFNWMARLNDWGAGACLADDMGLGKTVQTIAMLLHKSKSGPSLVVAPASVLPNWIREINRFAPSLNVINLAPVGERSQRLSSAKENDVCVITYGILVSEVESIIEKSFSMTVLDEAHTIKNKETKMSKAAMQLKSDFRLLLTGTPIQNHLGEIWNLFNFINPSLLGSFESFRQRFVVPIVEFKDREQQRRLKRLISPFLLRRTKTAVLDELPPKTEVIKEIQMSEAEISAYEVLRRDAENRLLESTDMGQIVALAEITRLRMAAANINLSKPGLNLASSKIQTFLDIVDDLKENNHRSLVFSQFTSHLALIKKELDKKGIAYLYLDGSTSIVEREKLVKRFQEGDDLLFLISLKAGGLGLNLTAADFVIHMDPWWNPAIEDQASDRAYRIGQKRPVTIYRLIARNTIEEKIIRLHSTKKDLADSLLEGTDVSNRLTREELLELLRN